MEVLLESEEQMGRNKQKGRGKRQRPAGPPAPSPAVVADQTGRIIGRAGARVARTSDDRPGELRRRGARGSRASAAAGRPLRRRAVGQGQ